MKTIKYRGASTVREVTISQLEGAGIQDHEDMNIYIDTRKGERERIVDVSDATAALLLENEPDDWFELTPEEVDQVKAVDDSVVTRAQRVKDAEEAERAEVEANRQRAEEERDRLGLDNEGEEPAPDE